MRQAHLKIKVNNDNTISIWSSTKCIAKKVTMEEVTQALKINAEYPELTVFSKAKLYNCYVSANVMSLYAGN